MKGALCGRQTIGRARIAEFSIGRACPTICFVYWVSSFSIPIHSINMGTPLVLYGFCPALCTLARHLPPSFRLIYSHRGYKSRENCRSFRNTPFPPLPLLRTPQREKEECAMNGLVGCLARSFISGVATLLPIRKKAQRPTNDAGIRDAIDIRSQPR